MRTRSRSSAKRRKGGKEGPIQGREKRKSRRPRTAKSSLFVLGVLRRKGEKRNSGKEKGKKKKGEEDFRDQNRSFSR